MANRIKRFVVTLIKPSRYDRDGYVIQWRKSCVPSNSLGCLYALTRDCAERQVLGADVEFDFTAYDEPNTIVPIKEIIEKSTAADAALVCMVGVQSNQFPRAMDMVTRFRAAGIPVAIGGFHVSGCLSMLKEIPADIQKAIDMGCSIFAGEAEEGRYEGMLKDVWAGAAKPVYNYMNDLPDLAGEPTPFLPDYVVERITGHYATFDSGRGCPYQCSFCSIINVQGRTSRWRTPDDIEKVIRENMARGTTRFVVTDDNFARNKDWEPVLDRMIKLREEDGLKFKFFIQADALCHKTPGFIEKCARAGCHWVYVGLENINPENLIAAKKRQNKIWEYRKMLLEWKKHGVMTYCGYITGFPHDTGETIVRDIEIIKKELPIELIEIFFLTPLPGSEDHKRLTEAGTWMDPDMNKYALTERVTHHSKMTDKEWEEAYYRSWETYYNAEHVETILRRAAAVGKDLKRMVWPLMWFWACHSIEKVHPVEAGYFRRKVRTERRPGMKVLNPLIFYSWYWADFGYKFVRWMKLLYTVQALVRKIKKDPNHASYMDQALRPARDEESDEEREMMRVHAAAANKVQRAHIKIGGAEIAAGEQAEKAEAKHQVAAE